MAGRDPIYNARRRAKTYIRNLERLAESQNPRQATATRKYIEQLNQNVQATYLRGNTRERALKAVSRLNNLIGNTGQKMTAIRAADALFQREIARASVVGDSPFLGENANIKVKAFFRVTQRYWEGSDPTKRFEAIKKGLGFKTVEQAFNYVMETQSDEIKAIIEDDSLSDREKYETLRALFVIL